MVNVNKCKDIWQFYPLLKQILATNPDGFQEFVEANFENAQDVYNMFEGGVSQDSTSPVLEQTEHVENDSTPQEMQFVPSRPSHTVEETLLDTDTLMLGGARLGILFTDFKRRIVSASILDLQTCEPILNQNKTGVGANEMTGLNRTILNTNIGKYKLELLNKVSKYICGPVYNTMEEACEVDENGMYKWESTLQEFASREADTNSPEYMSARESAVILKQFDNWLASNAPFIRIATPYKDTHLFNPDRYVYVGPSTKMFQSFSSDEYMDAHKYGLSDLVKTVVDVFPEYTKDGQPIPGTQVGVAGMYSIGTKLKHYFQNSGYAETRVRWYKGGVNRDWNKLFEDYINFVNTNKSSASASVETETDKDITTLTTKMYGLQKLFAILPDDLKILFSHTIDKTVASEYRAAELETTKFGENTIVYGRAKNYSERPQTTWKSYIRDCVLGASMLLRTTPSMKAALNQKYKIEFKNSSIYVNDKPFVTSTEAGWSLVETDHELIKALAQDVLQFPIPEEYSEIHAFFPAAAKDRNSKGMPAWGKLVATVLVNGYAPLNNIMNPQDRNVAEIAKVMSVIYGSESATVVKNQKGNNLPMHQVTCLAYRHLDVVEHMRQLVAEIEDNEDNEDDTSIDRVKSNLIFQNSRQVLTPQCRTDFISGSSGHKTSTSLSKLNARDSLACSMIFDFWKPLFEQDSDNHGRIALQAHTYADKSKQLLQRFDLRTRWKIADREVDFLALLQQICNGNKDSIVEMANIWRELEKEQINLTVQNIISDFREVYGKNFTTIRGVNDFLASQIKHADGTVETRSLESVRKDFLEAGVPFIENYHAVMFDGKVRMNECITTFHKTVNDDALWKDFYTNQFNNFKESAREALIPAAHLFTIKNGDQYTPYNMRGKQEKGKEDYIPLNFVAAAYFFANNIFEGQYNRLMVGDYYLHDNKAKGTTDPSVAAASRYISQIKRMVIYGATTHTYAQGLDNGVKSTVSVAVMEDLPSSVQNMLGETATTDSCDGSGLTSPYYSRMENNSLLDAAVKDVKKTIMHDIGANGVPVLLKWAEYAITNEKRRMSYGSNVPYNHIFNKMHSQPVYVPEGETLQTAEAKTIYYRDQNTGEHHKRVIKVYNENGNNVAAYYDFVVDVNGKTISEPVAYKESFKTIADLDAIFGGCWSESFNENNELEYSESSLDEVFDLIVKYDWRDKMIGIVANKSAVKVGVQNLNSVDAWTSPNDDRNPLHYFSMSTKFGGLQMDADHDLEDSDVTEMTQMISALVQNGYSIEIADKVYRDIGAYCVESIADIREALKDVDSDKLFQIFGKAIVEAFATGDKDTLGLAQAFIAIATKNMQESGLKPIPFSSMSINGIFNSTVTTTLVKKAIRRHYEGVAAVLNPSFGSIQIYNIEGSTYTYPELLDWYLSHKTIDKNTWSLTQLLNVAEFGDSINPTYKVVDPTTYIDFEDTITWKNDDGTWSSHKVTDYKTYWEARRIVNDHDKVYIKTLAPKNLKGADTKFTLAATDGTGATATRNSSMFETVYAQLLYATYDIKANTTEDVVNQVKAILANLLGVANDAAWEETFNVKYKDILVNAFGNLGMNSEYSYKRLRRRLAKSQQKFLGELHKAQENISESDPIYTFNMNGAEYNISSVEVVPAQIIMGRYYAKQFGLSTGDSIGKIRNDENFFFNKAKTQYKTDANGNVDLVLYDGQGDQIHVIYDPDGRKTQSISGQLSRCNGFTIVDGNVYYKDKLLCNNENKQFYSYKVGDVEHKLVIVSHLNALSDLTKNDWTDYTECLYRQDNAAWILNTVRGKTISENLVTPEGIKSLLAEEKTLKNRHVGNIAFSRKKSFEKSLNFIGTRIPCQSMQSFAPMRVAAFSNSTTNEVFVPTNIMWLEGSDLDIDKQYILGYSIADSGRIFDGEGDHHKEDRLKNNVVDNIWKTVTDPRNQINLTQPISTDDFKTIAAKSSRGKLAEGMSIYNPFHKYSMQVENMVGKDCIGSVATALKGFFALTYMYNMRMNEMCDAIESGNIDEAMRLFDRYFTQPLANVNVERLDYVLTLLPEGDFKNKLFTLKDKIEDQEDMSMLMGQLLNAATDNAKELILKKINADSTWIDLYTSAFMEGKSLEEVSLLMLDPRSQQIFDGFDSSVFAGNRPFGKLPYLTGVKLETTGEDPILDQLIDQAELAEETRVLGRFLKINQGLITNRAEMLAYVGDIQAFVEKRFEKSTNLKEYRKYLNKLNEHEELTIKETEELYKLLPDLAHDINTGKGIFEAQQILQKLVSDEIGRTQFDVYKFASDSDYRTECIEHYEKCKVKFNILEAVATSPHFDKMFGMVSTNEAILTSLSARNRLEGLVVDQYRQQARLENWSNGNINASTAKNLKDRVDDVLRKDWILEQGIEIPIIKGQRYWNGTKFVEAGSTKQTRLAINDEKQILSLRQFLENIVIPLAKEQHPENKFLSSITMGLQGGIQYWRPMINMSTVSQSIKTKEQYEGMANDFAKLADVNFAIDGIDTGHTIVDWIYLYNLIVNRDRFGATTFTRFFESLVPTGRVDYFAFDFANWLDNIDVEQTFENHRAEFLRYAYEDDPESDTYADHFGIRGKEAIVEDSETFDPWDELKYNSGATDKEIEGYKQRADKLYIVPVVSVNNPSSRQMPEDFSWSGNKQKWIVTFEGSASYQVLSGLKVGDSVTFGKNSVQIQAPLRKWINDGELETVGVAKAQTPAVDAKNLSTPLSFHAFSGAADGADTEWKEVAKLWGIDTTDYTVESYDALDSNWKNTIEEAYQKAVKDLGRFAYGPSTVGGKLVRRDYLQARKADAVFAIGKIVTPGEVGLPNSSGKTYENKTSHDIVDGGTGYAVQMAINMGKPVRVFDPYRKGWYVWNGSSFVEEDVPTLTPKFAAVGSRNLVELPGEEWVRAKLAIRRVFEKTAEKYGWDKSRKAKVDLISFNDVDTMKQHSSSISNGVITTRQSGNQHYGNPFTHRTGTQATVILPTVKDAVAAYKAWLLGESSFVTSEGKTVDISNVEPEHRKWIQDQISSGALDGKTLIYYTTKIGSPNGYKTPDGKTPVYFSDEFPSHAHVLKELVNGRNNESKNKINSENFTTQPIIENNKNPKSEPSLSINPEQKSSSETKAQLKELISSINSPYLKEVTDSDLEGVDDFTADAEGFVKDGIIYINTDRASVGTVIHELGHLYLGALKSDPEKREHYYDILANMHEYCDLWHEMQGNQFYANKRGSDFDEEIAARLIEMYYNGSIMSERDKALAQELIMISGISLENLPKPEKMQWMSENYKIKQNVATLKNKLYEDEVIKDIDC